MTTASCPQCGQPLKSNAIGAWCEAYPCRYVLNLPRVQRDARIARQIWGRLR